MEQKLKRLHLHSSEAFGKDGCIPMGQGVFMAGKIESLLTYGIMY